MAFEESNSWRGKPSLVSTLLAGVFRGFLYAVLSSASLLPIIGVALIGLGESGAAVSFIAVVIAFIFGAMLLISIIQYAQAQYSVDESAIEARVGVFKPTNRVIQYDEITSLQLKRDTADSVADTGTLVIRTEDHETSLRRISDPQQVLTLIEKQTGERS